MPSIKDNLTNCAIIRVFKWRKCNHSPISEFKHDDRVNIMPSYKLKKDIETLFLNHFLAPQIYKENKDDLNYVFLHTFIVTLKPF